MLTQAVGSSAVGLLVERGHSYDAVFAGAASLLGATVVALVFLERTGRLPG